MKKKSALGIFVLIILFLSYVGFQPSDYVVSRKTTMNAPASKIFPYLNNVKLADQWGPWMEIDPDAKMSYAGPNEGVGATSRWDGGKKLGTGSAVIVRSVPGKVVGIKIEYSKPMVMEQYSEYILEPNGNQTDMTWKVQGKNTFMGKLMSLFFNMDKMVGGMFEKGLSNLKKIVEK